MSPILGLLFALLLLALGANAEDSGTMPPLTPSPTTAPPVVPPPTVAPTIVPVTSQPTTLVPIVVNTPSPSPSPITPETAQPVTAQPMTAQPTTARPVLTFQPVTPQPVTPAPVVATLMPTTMAPIAVTLAPVAATLAPTTGAPVTLDPTTPSPVSAAPVTAAPVTLAPITFLPSFTPPSDMPSMMPSGIDSAGPSVVPSDLPSKLPTVVPSSTPTLLPSLAPSAMDTAAPTPIKVTAEPFTSLSMVFTGMSPLSPESISKWEETTKMYAEEYYMDQQNIDRIGASGLTTTFTVTGQDPPFGVRRFLWGRMLQDQQTTLTYTQDLSYVVENPDVGPNDVVDGPFLTSEDRTDYVLDLVLTGDDAFADLTTTSNVRFPDPSKEESGGLSTGAIIGIAVGGAAGALLLIGGFMYMRARSSNLTGYHSGVGDNPPTSIKAGGDDVSTLAEPGKMGAITSNESLAGYGERSVATVDYDYSKAYGGGADHSVSSAGGTFGSNPQALGANQDAAIAAGAATLGSYSDDGSFDAGGASVREELIDIYAPAGKLGVVIDTPDDGAPVVHAIKDSSVIAEKLQVGDKLVAVDDEDVRTMTAIKVSKLISRKSGNPTRKLSIIRTTVAE